MAVRASILHAPGAVAVRRAAPRRVAGVRHHAHRPFSLKAIVLGGRRTTVRPSVEAAASAATEAAARPYPFPEVPEGRRVANLETMLQERDGCGVGFIANLKGVKSHKIVEQALQALSCMEHRGACSADNDSGDGAGLMTQVPWKVIAKDIAGAAEGSCGVGMVFLPQDSAENAESRKVVEAGAAVEGFEVLGWREVPIDASVVGKIASATQPQVAQVVLKCSSGRQGAELERGLYRARKAMEKGHSNDEFYVCSMSGKTMVYKGMLRSAVVGAFFKDLVDADYVTAFAIYHRRFSTNTTPKWPLAQPMRVLGHNGEINTLQGNLNWMASRSDQLTHPIWEGKELDLMPLTTADISDSANLDRTAELMLHTGEGIDKALMVLIPEAYANHPDLDANYPEVKDFYRFYEGMQEGWDGPALIVFSDGDKIGARLDRNGLRPARFWQTSDDTIYVASEVGVLGDVITNAANVVDKGRLGPGQMVVADLTSGTFKKNTELALEAARAAPYSEYLATSKTLDELTGGAKFLEECSMTAAEALKRQAASGMGLEDTSMVIEGMAQGAVEPTYCMGDDNPLAVLSDKPHMMYTYFKQRFAQVTNPPIDPLREGLVMSLDMRLGARGNLLEPGPDSYTQIMLASPVILESELEAIKAQTAVPTETIPTFFSGGTDGALEAAVQELCAHAEASVRAGKGCLILSDRSDDMEPGRVPIPTLLAVGAVHHHLIRTGLRSDTSIVAETAQCFSTHHVAVLVGYGVHAVCPYLGFETCRQWRASSRTANLIKVGKMADISATKAQKNYKKALEKGVLKILSKMGISLLSCYHGAQIFEAYGLGRDVVDVAFTGSVSRIGGLSFADLQAESETFWGKGFPEKAMTKLEDYGFIQSRTKGEHHANNQVMAKLLHKSIGLGGKERSEETYDAFMKHFEEVPVTVLRDCLRFESDRAPISIDEVESAKDIMARFCTGGMSLGAISRETHETIAIAMNRIGGKSNSGEGGEDPVRWLRVEGAQDGKAAGLPHLNGLQDGDIATSKIKQVASGRFGVTPEFLVNADQLEIKVAQGAKPGEGGQLPGKKVSPYIASLRRSKPGVPLISPPPHHDIYSIEDLAQLIYDLHMIQPTAKVSVKLVGEAGIGTVASGVSKANADVIQVSGHDGGTGASPISSIKHAGGPVEMGCAETHQALVANDLRERVVLRADGGLRNGRDVMMLAALGADEYGFGTVAMIATGCIMARVCHTNNCPVGVASQKEELRARFPGVPQDLVNFFHFVAEEVRAELARLGYTSLNDIVGRADLLRQRDITLGKTAGLDLSFLTTYAGECGSSKARIAQATHSNGPVLDDGILADAAVAEAIATGSTVERSYDIVNTDRAALARVAGEIARKWGDHRCPGMVTVNLEGSAGQSFAAFVVNGMDIKLVGEANDYVGKGMAGGTVTIVPPPNAGFVASEASIVGNTCLYGATGGKLFVNGRAGERFAVRNSMADTVVEGTGDHCCEYMTGGTVVVIGSIGRNVAAGMTGGLGYFYDEDGSFCSKVNAEIVTVQRIQTDAGFDHLQGLLAEHAERTGSAKATAILAEWDTAKRDFWQLVPPSEADAPMVNPNVPQRVPLPLYHPEAQAQLAVAA